MNRIQEKIRTLQQEKRKALVAFITAGFPEADATEELVHALEQGGVDIVELGVPFSDPVADGPTIQHSSDVALKNGVSLESVLAMVRAVREKSQVPIILMGYLNPLYHRGLETVMKRISQAGADGLIIPDIIPEESAEVKQAAEKNGLSIVFMAAPNTPGERLGYIDEESTAFVYVVSLTGVTGGRRKLPPDVKKYLASTKKHIRSHPRFVGFGISSPEQVRDLKPFVDGVIVGSALIDIIANTQDRKKRQEKVRQFAGTLRRALDH